MKHILMIGAGKSATAAISYFLSHAKTNKWQLTLADYDTKVAALKLQNSPYGIAKSIDVTNAASRRKLIAKADLVVSMMPPAFHLPIIKDCIALKKDFINASYATPEIKALAAEAKKAGIRILCEMGLDPGIDHLSAMKTIHELQTKGAKITAFRSYCGGLVAPISDNNPWHYKFSWNPRNVILAGQGTAQYREGGLTRYIPYNRLFTQTAPIQIEGYAPMEAYANRDSLSYIALYGLTDAATFLRGTLRVEGFCKAWDALVQIGLTDDSYTISNSATLTYKEWVKSYFNSGAVQANPHMPIINVIAGYLAGSKKKHEIIPMLESIGLFSDEVIGLNNATPAQILQQLLEKAWQMQAHDKDMIVMQHQFEYSYRKKNYRLNSTLVLEGEDQVHTAMAKTVGLPLAIGARLLLQRKIKEKGVLLPLTSEIYTPVLSELEKYGIHFKEKITPQA